LRLKNSREPIPSAVAPNLIAVNKPIRQNKKASTKQKE
jgi:hypothetical protein